MNHEYANDYANLDWETLVAWDKHYRKKEEQGTASDEDTVDHGCIIAEMVRRKATEADLLELAEEDEGPIQ